MPYEPSTLELGTTGALAFPWQSRTPSSFPSPSTLNPSAPLEDLLKRGREFLGEKELGDGAGVAVRKAAQGGSGAAPQVLTGFEPELGPSGPTPPSLIPGGAPPGPPGLFMGDTGSDWAGFNFGNLGTDYGTPGWPSSGGGTSGGLNWLNLIKKGIDLAKTFHKGLRDPKISNVTTGTGDARVETGSFEDPNFPGMKFPTYGPAGTKLAIPGWTPAEPVPIDAFGAGVDPTVTGLEGPAAGSNLLGTAAAYAGPVLSLAQGLQGALSGKDPGRALTMGAAPMATTAGLQGGIQALTGLSSAAAAAAAAPYAAALSHILTQMLGTEVFGGGNYTQARKDAGDRFGGLEPFLHLALMARSPQELRELISAQGGFRGPTFGNAVSYSASGVPVIGNSGLYDYVHGLDPYNDAIRGLWEILNSGQTSGLAPIRESAARGFVGRIGDRFSGLGSFDPGSSGRDPQTGAPMLDPNTGLAVPPRAPDLGGRGDFLSAIAAGQSPLSAFQILTAAQERYDQQQLNPPWALTGGETG